MILVSAVCKPAGHKILTCRREKYEQNKKQHIQVIVNACAAIKTSKPVSW
jgi:hypothetical protein